MPCDAFEQPGRLLVDLSALHTQWRPLDDDACPPLPPYLPALRQLVLGDAPEPRQGRSPKQLQLVASEPLPPLDNAPDPNASVDPLAFLERSRKRPPTVLVLGDATDDDGLDQICSIFQQRTATFPSPPRGAGSSDSRLDDFLYASEGDLAAGQSRRKPALRRCELARADGRGTALRVLGAPFGGSRLAALPLSALEELGGAVGVDVVMVHSGALEAVRGMLLSLLSPRAPLTRSHPASSPPRTPTDCPPYSLCSKHQASARRPRPPSRSCRSSSSGGAATCGVPFRRSGSSSLMLASCYACPIARATLSASRRPIVRRSSAFASLVGLADHPARCGLSLPVCAPVSSRLVTSCKSCQRTNTFLLLSLQTPSCAAAPPARDGSRDGRRCLRCVPSLPHRASCLCRPAAATLSLAPCGADIGGDCARTDSRRRAPRPQTLAASSKATSHSRRTVTLH